MADKGTELQAQLAELRAGYAERLPGQIADIGMAWRAVREATESLERQQMLARLAHNLVGSAATYGFPEISACAQELEHRIVALAGLAEPDAKRAHEEIDELVGRLDDVGRTSVQEMAVSAPTPDHVSLESVIPTASGRAVYLIDGPSGFAGDLARQLGHFGYRVTSLNGSGGAANAMAVPKPVAVIATVAAGDDGPAGERMIETIRTPDAPGHGSVVPLLLISPSDDFAARLSAVRQGCDAYLTQPVDIYELVEALDRYTVREEPEPYRVLVIDDSPSVADFCSAVLSHAGMVTSTVINPLQAIDSLVEFNPDLILMDVYMPGCTGPELAAVIRQQSAYMGVPIVFLSSEVDRDKQLSALSVGGDEFLTKPIQPDHLVAAVRARAERWHMVQSLMVRDGLTGLANHTRITEQLRSEVTSAAEAKGDVSFALIDIDHIRSINETHGYVAGDRVIKCLSRLLREHFPHSDVIGRYSGSEFAVILPGTDSAHAASKLGGLREQIADVPQRTGEGEFFVTISGGIAAFPTCGEAGTLISAAEGALERAKRAGRNRVFTTET